LNNKDLCLKAAEYIFSKKGYDVVLIDIREQTSITDYFLICSADSDTQIKAITDEIEKKLLENENIKPWHIEGRNNANWVLLDYVDFVIHIFKKETREYYALEKYWGDAPMEVIEDKLSEVKK
jgi:ribosome-associated protein